MSKQFNISIPKPCHEGWLKMTPNEKGRFCDSCAKTVVDFTKKPIPEIQKYIINNKENRICGHFYKKQLDTITIEIPNEVFEYQLPFQKLFLLALLLAMGSTLMSCNYNDGKKQKIDKVILIDSIDKVEKKIDSIIAISKDTLEIEKKIQRVPVLGNIIIDEEYEKLTGLVIEGNADYEEQPCAFIIVDEPPRFKGSEKLSKEKARDEFNKNINKFTKENFNYTSQVNLGLSSGKYKIYVKFVINEFGKIIDIQ